MGRWGEIIGLRTGYQRSRVTADIIRPGAIKNADSGAILTPVGPHVGISPELQAVIDAWDALTLGHVDSRRGKARGTV